MLTFDFMVGVKLSHMHTIRFERSANQFHFISNLNEDRLLDDSGSNSSSKQPTLAHHSAYGNNGGGNDDDDDHNGILLLMYTAPKSFDNTIRTSGVPFDTI